MPPGARCASCSGYGRPSDHTTQVPAVLRERGGASDSGSRQSAPTSVVLHVQCKLCKSRRSHRAVLRRCLRAHCCALTGAGDDPDSAENREVPARVLGLGSMPVVAQRQVPDGRDSASKLWNLRSWCCSWTTLLTCPCWPRHWVVEVPQLQFIDWCVSSSWL